MSNSIPSKSSFFGKSLTPKQSILVILASVTIIALLSKSDHRATASSTPSARVGDSATVRKDTGFWPCGSTPEAFDELMKWAVRKDNDEVKRTLRQTGSLALDGGMQVKILDSGFGKRKVRVLTNSVGQAVLKDNEGEFAADSRIGRECWVVSEAIEK